MDALLAEVHDPIIRLQEHLLIHELKHYTVGRSTLNESFADEIDQYFSIHWLGKLLNSILNTVTFIPLFGLWLFFSVLNIYDTITEEGVTNIKILFLWSNLDQLILGIWFWVYESNSDRKIHILNDGRLLNKTELGIQFMILMYSSAILSIGAISHSKQNNTEGWVFDLTLAALIIKEIVHILSYFVILALLVERSKRAKMYCSIMNHFVGSGRQRVSSNELIHRVCVFLFPMLRIHKADLTKIFLSFIFINSLLMPVSLFASVLSDKTAVEEADNYSIIYMFLRSIQGMVYNILIYWVIINISQRTNESFVRWTMLGFVDDTGVREAIERNDMIGGLHLGYSQIGLFAQIALLIISCLVCGIKLMY
jgi:hypothetical protein